MSVAPVARPASRPSGPSRRLATSWEVGMQVTTSSAPRTAAAGVGACCAPCCFAKSAAFDVVRFHTVSGSPDAATRTAIGRPIAPSPRKAMFIARTYHERMFLA